MRVLLKKLFFVQILIISLYANNTFAANINAQEYGVKCDGHSDDTNAINHVLEVGKGTTIILPAGDCQYSGGGILKDGTIL